MIGFVSEKVAVKYTPGGDVDVVCDWRELTPQTEFDRIGELKYFRFFGFTFFARLEIHGISN